jgi:RNA polymerase sigma-70 factor (ECF subfamily)
MDSQNDTLLFQRISEGDEQAFRTLFYEYLPIVKSVVTKLTNDDHAHDELMQEVFLRIWLSRDQLTTIEHPRSWILHIVHTRTFNWLKSRKKRTGTFAELNIELQHTQQTEDTGVLNETKKLIAQGIDELPDQARKIYRLNREEGYTIQQIADQLKLAPQTVKNTLGRATRSLRDYLQSKGISIPVLLIILISKNI